MPIANVTFNALFHPDARMLTAALWTAALSTQSGSFFGHEGSRTQIVRSKNASSAKLIYEVVGLPAGFSADCPSPSPLPGGLMLAPFAANPAGLLQYQSQGQACVSAMVAIAAAHWILQQ